MLARIAIEALAQRGLRPDRATVAVRGFGKVGRYTARFLAEAGARVVAVADEHGAIGNATGLDVPAVEAHVDATGSVVGFPWL
jgi:glutamate dehydrogenase (NAD(P)+)